jgi:hypothetical protein
MSAHSSGEWLLIFCTALIVVFRVYCLVRMFWDYPLSHGPGFFLGVEVAPGFYEGGGMRWLKRYRTVLLAEHSIEALALVAILVSSRWFLLPGWAGGTAVLLTATLFGFTGYTRATLGANPPVRPSVAIPLETRQLGDYISWPAEALIALIIALSWALLLIRGDAHFEWSTPVLMTYVILGMVPFKVGLVRNSFPLPSERPEEHHRWMEAQRRYSLRWIDAMRWFFLTIFGSHALLHGRLALGSVAWLRWSLIGLSLAIALLMMVIIVRGQIRLIAMGRDLRPVGSWSTPFRPARLMMPGYTIWFALWFGGLMLLVIYSQR